MYSRYLTGRTAGPYVIRKYKDYHLSTGTFAALKFDRFDRFLVSVSARGPAWARLADSYASRLRKQSAVRKKLVLTLALLECVPPTCDYLDATGRAGAAAAFAGIGWNACRYVAALLVSVLLFAPVQMFLAVSPRRSPVPAMERR